MFDPYLLCLPVAGDGILWSWLNHRPGEEHQERPKGRLDRLHFTRDPQSERIIFLHFLQFLPVKLYINTEVYCKNLGLNCNLLCKTGPTRPHPVPKDVEEVLFKVFS